MAVFTAYSTPIDMTKIGAFGSNPQPGGGDLNTINIIYPNGTVDTFGVVVVFTPRGDINFNTSLFTSLTRGTSSGLGEFSLSGFVVTWTEFNNFDLRNDPVGLFGYMLQGSDSISGSSGDDVLRGFGGNDTYFVTGGDKIVELAGGGTDTVYTSEDFVLGSEVEILFLQGVDNLSGTGNTLSNRIVANAGINNLQGLAGNDVFEFQHAWLSASDVISGGIGTDRIEITGSIPTFASTPQIQDEVFTNTTGIETVTLLFGGNDVRIELGSLSEAAGILLVDGSTLSVFLTLDASARSAAITLQGGTLADTLTGGAGKDVLTGGAGNDTLVGGLGVDALRGGIGDDTYHVGSGDVVTEAVGAGFDEVFSADSFTLSLNVEKLTLTGTADANATGNSGINTLIGNAGNNRLDGGAGADTLIGGAGNDTYVLNGADIIEIDADGNDTVETAGTFDLRVRSGSDLENVTLLGVLAVNATGNELANILKGNSANNTLDGGGGADDLRGGLGNDTYVVDNAGDIVTESAASGSDLVKSSVTFTLSANVESLTLLAGFGAIDATGNASANILLGNESNNRLNGLGGADTMTGGLGDDTYVVDSALDSVREVAGQGTDTVESLINLTLVANVENLTLVGSANLVATGNAVANTLTGNSGNNTLSGLAGNDILNGGLGNDTLVGGLGEDTLAGGLGDDTYILELTGDTVIEDGGAGTDTVQIGRSVDLTTEFDNVENVTLSVAVGLFNLIGDEADNVLKGNGSVNILRGNAGDDRLEGGAGVDTLDGGLGDDTYVLNGADIIEADTGGNDTVEVAASYLVLRADLENITLVGTGAFNATGNASANTLKGNAAANILDGKEGIDRMEGGGGNDVYIVDDEDDEVVETIAGAAGGIDRVDASVSYSFAGEPDRANIEHLTLKGVEDIDGTGNGLNNTINGNTGDNRLDGGLGNDTLIGGLGDDTYVVDSTLDKVTESLNAGEDTVEAWVSHTLATNVEHLKLMGTALLGTGNALNNELTGNDGDNTLDGKAGADTLAGGLGNDIYVIDNAGDIVVEAPGGGDNDTVRVAYTAAVVPALTLGNGILANIEHLEAIGTGTFSLTGDAGNNKLTGNTSANVLIGLGGDDTLDGKGGADRMEGGDGDDLYKVDNSLDDVVEGVGQGEDTIESTANYRIDTREHVEHILLAGTAAINATGNGQANELTGNNAANTLTGLGGDDFLDGMGGIDRLVGGMGDDTYHVNVTGDVIIETAGEGTDVVFSLASYTLSLNVENLTLEGAANINATGNAGDNELNGNSGNNILDGKAGIDTMAGGAGNDTYRVDNTADMVEEELDEGIDLVESTATYTLSANVEKLTLMGTLAINGTGNELDNIITGNAAINSLAGGAGNDTLNGGGGNDILTGGEDDDTLNGGAGADTMTGGEGDDTYVVDNAGDLVTEEDANGNDTVQSSINYVLGANLESLLLLGSTGIRGTGNVENNTLTGNGGGNALNGEGGNDLLVGNAGNDTLDGGEGEDELNGGTGADTMRGGAGNDLYRVDSTSDKVIENVGEGTDTVHSTISFSLVSFANVENLILDGSAALGATGNAEVNTLTGNGGNNTLDGKAGADHLIGKQGNDTYVVDNAGDEVEELAGEGIDLVKASISYTLADNVENLLLEGSAADGIGNSLGNTIMGNGGNNILLGLGGNDTLVGNAGNDELDGGTGNDVMQGGAGNDTYYVDAAGDVVTELANAGIDTVLSSITYQLSANVENLTLVAGAGDIDATGNGLANVITGNDGNNVLDGGAGNDTLIGGQGDDQYIVNAAGDIVTEVDGQGNDTVSAAMAAGATYVLGSHVENLVLTGSLAARGTGNELDNDMTGNEANNILSGLSGDDTLDGGDGNDTLNGGSGDDDLDGGTGNDSMNGGVGDDSYWVDSTSDAITELPDAGDDRVVASASFTLGANVERLTFANTAALNGAGNDSDNEIIGNDFVNVLAGEGGDDVLKGLNGDDTLRGDAGDDSLDGGTGADTLEGGSGDDVYLVDNADDVAIEQANAGADTVRSTVNYVLGANIENLVLVEGAEGDGNSASNTITGNSGSNRLDGKGGEDLLIGGAGDDVYVVDERYDIVSEDPGEGTDRILSYASSYGLSDDVENATLMASGIKLIGNLLDNVIGVDASLTAGSEGVRIDGGDGNDDLTGSDGDDFLDISVLGVISVPEDDSGFGFLGSNGADHMAGGLGDDTYGVQDEGDVVVELIDGGIDKVILSGAGNAVYVLPDFVENVFSFPLPTIVPEVPIIPTDVGREIIGNILNNEIQGNLGKDVLRGEAGDDLLDGGHGADDLYGGTGNDVFVFDAGDRVFENADEGKDTVRARANVESLADNVERLEALSDSGMTLKGNGLANEIVGADGNDNLYGLDGDDFLDGGLGSDTLHGGIGDDIYVVNAGDSVVEDFSEGSDQAQFRSLAHGDAFTLAANVEKLLMLEGVGGEIGIGNDLGNVIVGNLSDNELRGMDGDDEIFGGGGRDTLYGGGGADELDGGGGTDHMYGGAGDDLYWVDSALGELIFEFEGEGTDTAYTTVHYSLFWDAPGVENLILLGILDLAGFGNDLGNTITGNLGRNVLSGGDGNDLIDGGLGDDGLNGDGGDDILVFDSEDTFIAGGSGLDTLRFTGFGQMMDFSVTTKTYDRLEIFDLTDAQDAGISISAQKILDLSDNDRLMVVGDSDDTFESVGQGWVQGADILDNGIAYHTYTAGAASLWVDTDVDVLIS